MWSIAKRELRVYFSQLTGYVIVAGYLLITALILWFFNTPFNLINSELGSYSPFFEFTPILFLFLIPALSMRSFSEEFAQGTFELLMTKPLSPAQIFGGKLMGVMLILLMILIPTLVHAVALDNILQLDSKLDWGIILSAYVALLFLALLFVLTSICASLLFQSQVASFLVAVLGCFIHLYFWSFLADLSPNLNLYQGINSLSAQVHYNGLSRGVIVLEDMLYFIGLSVTFFFLGVQLIQKKKNSIQTYRKPFLALLLTLVFMVLSQQVGIQKDLTTDQRYSLSNSSISQLEALDGPVRIDVFLSGELPGLYRDFWRELNTFLNQMQFHTDELIIQFNDPYEIGSNEQVFQEMQRYGMSPEIVVESKDGQRSESSVFPWMIINYGEVSERVFLIDKQFGDTERAKITRSIQQLEYLILDGIRRVTLKEKPNLAVLTSHQTSENIKLADLLQSLKPYYNLASFNLKNSETTPLQSLTNLRRFDALLVSNPNKPFSQSEKYILDQYELHGGSILWTVNGIGINRDSLFNNAGKAYGFPLELNLDDYFFNRGVRLNKMLVQDLYSAPLVLATGNQNNTQYVPYPWPYFPLPTPESNLIGKSVGPVLTQFASPLDSLKNSMNKTVLLQTSAFTKTSGVPVLLSLEEATQKIQPIKYNESSKILGILTEGSNQSLFANRIKPIDYDNHLDEGSHKTIIFGDGTIGENQIDKGAPLQLGYDKWTSNYYANKQLLMNSIHYLTGNQDGLMIRQKEWNFAYLDPQKIKSTGFFWKLFLVLGPVFFSLIFGWFLQRGRSKHLLS